MKVLIFSYYWPPSGGSGVQRWVYFSKYLNEFGIEPIIITVNEKYASYPSEDFSLNEDIKHVRFYKTKTFEPLGIYSFIKSGKRKKIIPQGNVGGNKKSVFDKIATFIRANYFIPDARIGWNSYALKEARKLIKKEKIDLIITTGPPHSTHLIGQKLQKEYGLKWMVDFRDPWTEVFYNKLFKRTKKNKRIDEEMEISVLNNADIILTIGPSMLDLLTKKIIDPEKPTYYIYNGFDEQKFNSLKKNNNALFTIRYLGTLNSNYPYKSFIDAIKKITTQPINIEFIGNIEENVKQNILTEDSIQVNFFDNVPHIEAIQKMKDADLLLLILPEMELSQIMLTGKLFEYIASKNPILCIGDKKTDAAKIINQISNSSIFNPTEIDSIYNFIIEKITSKNLVDNEFDSKVFGRRFNTEKLAEIIKFEISK